MLEPSQDKDQSKVSLELSYNGVSLSNSHMIQNKKVLNPPAIPNRCNVPRGNTSEIRGLDICSPSVVVGDHIAWFTGQGASKRSIVCLNRIKDVVLDAVLFGKNPKRQRIFGQALPAKPSVESKDWVKMRGCRSFEELCKIYSCYEGRNPSTKSKFLL